MKRPDGPAPTAPAGAALDEPRPQAGPGQDAAAEAEQCEMCSEVLTDRHGHLVDTEKRSLACACRACYLLFTHEGAAGGRYRAVPERICHDPERPLTDADWNELQIPVAMAFFFYNSALGRVVAGYPSPGGVTECELDLAAWDRLAAAYPLFGEMAPDVEAIFVNRRNGSSPGGRRPQIPPLGGTQSPGGTRSPQTPPDKGVRGLPDPDRRVLLAGRRAPAALAGVRRRGGGPRRAGHVPGGPAPAGGHRRTGALTWPT